MPPSQRPPPPQACPQPGQTPSYTTAEFEDIPLGRYPTLPAYMNPDIPTYPKCPPGRRDRLVERYHHWWRPRDSILTGILSVGIVAASLGAWVWKKEREDCLAEGELQLLERLLNLLLVVVAFTALTILLLLVQHKRLATPDYLPGATILVDVLRLLYWGGTAAWLCFEPAAARIVNAELSFYWNVAVALCIALGSISIFKLAMWIPFVMEAKWGGELGGQAKCQGDVDGRAAV